LSPGTEWLRITPTPYHNDALIDALAEALVDVWMGLGLPLAYRRSRQSDCHRTTASAQLCLALTLSNFFAGTPFQPPPLHWQHPLFLYRPAA
jgi:hypothetical protein